MIHSYPFNDIEEHELEGTQCWCVPRIIEEYGQIIVIHNAFDGRTLIAEEEENETKNS